MSFASPWLLWTLLLVPLALAAGLYLERRRSRYAVAFTNLDLLAAVAAPRRRWRRYVPAALFLCALAAASVALARPRAPVSVPSSRATVVLLVDVSGSMHADDIKPTRLDAAAHAMSAFADAVPRNVKIGLVSFSSEPNVLVAPTVDRTDLRLGIDLLVPEGGTAIGDGLAAAVRAVRQGVGDARRDKDGRIPGAIVLLSDGAQTRGSLSPLQGADRAKSAGIRVYTIALGTDHGTLRVGPFGGFGLGAGSGRRFPVRPDPVTLAAIARDTGGRTYRAQSASRADQIYKVLGGSIAHDTVEREITSWFLGVAAALLLLSVAAARAAGPRLP